MKLLAIALLTTASLSAQSDLLALESSRTVQLESPALAAAFHPNQDRIAVLQQRRLAIYDLTSGASLFKTLTSEASALAASRQGDSLAVGFSDGTVELWDWEGRQGPRSQLHRKAVRSLSFSPRGVLASASEDRSIAVSRSDSLQLVLRPPLESKQPFVFTGFSQGGLTLVGINSSGAVYEWDANTWKELRRFQLAENLVFSASMDASGSYLAIGCQFAALSKSAFMRASNPSDFFRDNRIAIYDLSSWKESKRIESIDGEIQSLEFSPDSRFLAAFKRKVRGSSSAIFDVSRGVSVFDSPAAPRAALLAFHSKGKKFASSALDGAMAIYSVSGMTPGSRPGDIAGSRIRITSSDVSPLLTGRKQETIAIMDLDSILLDRGIGQVFAEFLRSRVVNEGQKLVTLDRMKEVMRQQNFQQSDRTNPDTAAALGKILNARFIIYGTLSALDTSYAVTIHLVDVESARNLGVREALCQRCSLGDLPALAAEIEPVLVEKRR